MTEVNWHNLLFWDFVLCLIFKRSTIFWKPALFPLSGKDATNLVDPEIEVSSIAGCHIISNLLRTNLVQGL